MIHLKESENALSAADPRLAQLIAETGPVTLDPPADRTPYSALVRSVVYQQLSGKAAATILGRVINLFPDEDFPSPPSLLEMPDEPLRGAGLSRNKLLALRDIAARTLSGDIPTLAESQALSDQEIIERLVPTRGIGRWSVEMFLIFTLARPDVWPNDDLGVRRGVARTFGEDLPPKALGPWADRFAPHRTALALLMWRAADLKALPGALD
jgi:DNA-3-methyladenine glycosylase II